MDRKSHDHSHDSHAHSHGSHTHGHAPFAVSVGLNTAFAVAELVAGLLAGSVALVADAAHNFGDVAGLALAWGAARLATRKPSRKHTYGLRRGTILASLANAVLSLVAVGAVTIEALHRLRTPTTAQGLPMLVVASVGIVVNAGSALLFMKGRKRDANIRGAFVHLMGDAAVSAGVVIAGALVMLTGKSWLDPVASLVVAAVILASTWSLLRDALNLSLDAAPSHIDVDAVRDYLSSRPHVTAVHDLHIWALSTTETALTGHLVMDTAECPNAFLQELSRHLAKAFEIQHTTLQLEPPNAGACQQCG